jgi:hypothetical protein
MLHKSLFANPNEEVRFSSCNFCLKKRLYELHHTPGISVMGSLLVVWWLSLKSGIAMFRQTSDTGPK